MKIGSVMGAVGAMCLAGVMGSTFAATSMRDGEDQFAGFNSTKTTSEVQRELIDAKAEGVDAASLRDGNTDIGAHGMAGSRYSSRTRDEIQSEVGSRTDMSGGDPTKNLYFGD
jgi:hypothetical protein